MFLRVPHIYANDRKEELLRYNLFFVDWFLAVQPPIFARCPTFWNQLSLVESRTEPASQIPEEG